MSLDPLSIIDQFPGPAAIVRGPEHVFVATSAGYRQIIGGRDPAGRRVMDAIPELAAQGFGELLDRAYGTGETQSGRGVSARWDSDGDGVAEEHFVDYVYHPLREDGEVYGILIQVFEVTGRVRAEREHEFLLQASEVLASSLDYDTTLAAVARLAVQGIADWCAIDELAFDGTVRRIVVAHPDPKKVELAHYFQEKYPPDPASPTGVYNVIRTGEPEFMTEIPDELLLAAALDPGHLRLIRELDIRSYIVVPLKARGHVVGALTLVAGEAGRRYGPSDVALAQELASRAAMAIDNARLFKDSEEARLRTEEAAIELEAQAEELQSAQAELEMSNDDLQQANDELEHRAREAEEATREAETARARVERLQMVAGALSDAVSSLRVAEIAVENATAIFGAASAAVARLTPAGSDLEIIHATGLGADMVAHFRIFPVNAPLPLSDAVRERRPVFITSDADRALLYSWLVEEFPTPQQHAWAAIPLMVEGRVLGGLALGFPEPRVFTADERAFLEALGQQCAQALDRARLFQAEREARGRMEILADAGVLLAASLDLQATLSDLAHLIVPRVADWCFVEMPDEEGRIELVTVHHDDPAMVALAEDALRRYPLDPAATFGTAQVLRTGEPEMVTEIPEGLFDQVARDEEHAEIYRRAGFRSYLSVPLVVRRRTLGVLSLAISTPERRFGPDDLPFALELARRASMAIDNAQLYEAERHARTEAEEANRAKTEFLSAMSHELRTPLNAIAGYVDLLDLGIHGPLTDAQRKSLARVKRNQEILLGLISDVLNFARMEAGRIEYSCEPVAVETLLRGLEEAIGPQIRTNDVTYRHTSPGEQIVAWGDPDRIQQILLNLLTNAAKFTEPGGSISVGAEMQDSTVVIHVSDTGRGIPPDKLEAIFDPFVQLDRHRTDSSQQGVGLGLAISRQLARGMGGDLTVESAPEQGSTFILTLPGAR